MGAGRKPDFFIVGAPKCGTTALDNYLGQHPGILMGPKELHFFGSDLRLNGFAGSEQDYLRLFAQAGPEQRIGEASVYYLYSARAAHEIGQWAPQSRIVAMLRNPLEMLPSLHAQLLFDGAEDIPDFEQAVDAEARGHAAHRLRRGPLFSTGSFLDVARYSEQIARYLRVFGRDRVHVIIFDDFERDAARVYAQLCEFLGVDQSFVPKLRVINASHRWRSDRLRALVQHPPPVVRVAARAMPRPGRRLLAERLKRASTRYEPRGAISADLRERLRVEFRAEIETLSEVLDRDLSHWCAPNERRAGAHKQ